MLAPLRSVNDWTFSWLRNVFLKSFQDWLNFVLQYQGNFTKDAGQKIFISCQIYEGLKITVNRIIQDTQFLLWHPVKCVLTESFCQDAFENWFGRQRSLGSRIGNLSMVDFGYSNNAISNQKHFKPISNGDVADGGMIALTDELRPCWKPKRDWKFKDKSWIKKLIHCCFSQNTTKHNNSLLNVSILFLLYSL